ncbi:transposase [Mesorhizobium sp. M0500]|uniref:IS110 family transposase n=1 Tax=Mesorhizobium sp. M0500 TaxID=2956953 RepID=UPI00333D64EE
MRIGSTSNPRFNTASVGRTTSQPATSKDIRSYNAGDKLEEFARKELTHDDHVVIEATGNAAAVAEVLSPYVDRIVIANPKQVHMIAHAKVKTDTIDATVLAKLYASGFLPEVWVPDPGTLALRRQVTRRTQLVRQRSRLKNLIQSILHAHLIPPCPHGNLVGISGRKWLTRQILPADERAAIERHLGLINQINEALTVVEADIAVHALQDPTIHRPDDVARPRRHRGCERCRGNRRHTALQ